MTTKKKLVKPKKHTQSYYDYHEVENYLEKLHGKDFRDYAGKHSSSNFNTPYQDWWHWVIDLNDSVSNGSFIHLPDSSYLDDAGTEPWKKEIMRYFMDFLGEDYHERLWVEW